MLNTLTRYRKPVPGDTPVFARDPFVQFVDRFFNDLGPSLPSNWQANDRTFVPPVDVIETEGAFVVTADLPGLKKEDIDISLEDGVLTIAGDRKLETASTDEGKSFKRIERAHGRFSRSFTLPQGVDAHKVEATFTDGVLKLTLPKNEVVKARKIAIA